MEYWLNILKKYNYLDDSVLIATDGFYYYFYAIDINGGNIVGNISRTEFADQKRDILINIFLS